MAIAAVFFASGAAALVFEVVWFHRAGLVFGNDLWSTSLVLSTYMTKVLLAIFVGLFRRNAVPLEEEHR